MFADHKEWNFEAIMSISIKAPDPEYPGQVCFGVLTFDKVATLLQTN